MSTFSTCTSSTRPASPANGDVLFETDTKNVILWDGSNWRGYNNDGVSVPPISNTRSLFVDGTDDHAEVTGSAEIQISYPLTISAWIYPTLNAATGNSRTIISWGSALAGQGRFLQLVDSSNKLGFGTYQSQLTSSNALSLNNWYHVAATVTTGSTKLYVNGSLDTTGSNTLNSFTYTKTHVGELYYSSTTAARHFAGNIDELALYNSVLTDAEIAQVYNSGNPIDLNSNAGSYSSASNLKAWWRMGDGTEAGAGSTIYDMSTNDSNSDDLTIIQGSMTTSPTAP